VIFLGATLAALPVPAAAVASPDAQASIIGGKIAPITEFPSLAFIVAQTSKQSGFACTGTVIAPRVILTAGHCAEDLDLGGFTPASAYAVVTGVSNPHQAKSANLFPVAATHVFPGFDPGTLRGDASILVLEKPTPAPPIAMAGAADAPLYAGGASVQLAGWGLMHANATSEPRRLRTAPTMVLDPKACRARTHSFYPVYSANLQLCTTDPPAHRTGGCFGDSGGPVIAGRADGSPVEIGVVSTGGPACNPKLPNIFTRVDRVSTWATEWVAAVEAGGPSPDAAGVQAKIPPMSRESALGLVSGTLTSLLGDHFLRREGLRGGCKRRARARVSCELGWRSGANLYFGTISVFYALQRNAVTAENDYAFHRVNYRCWVESANRRRCAVETRRG
jgi:secreted trypsin-like serine protease